MQHLMNLSIRLIFVITFTTNFLQLYADEPPSWSPYTVLSKNQQFSAKIHQSNHQEQHNNKQWFISVFNSDSILLWKQSFIHSGHDGGLLSNDGKLFVTVEDWMQKDTNFPQVIVYTQNKRIDFSKDKFLPEKIPTQKTVSHQIWNKGYSITPNSLSDSTQINIQLLNGDTLKIMPWDRSISMQSNTTWKAQVNKIKQIAYVILVVLGSAIGFITYRKLKSLPFFNSNTKT